MNGRRNQPGSLNASDSEARDRYEIVYAAKIRWRGAEIPLDELDRLVPPVNCRRLRGRQPTAAKEQPSVQSTRGER